MPDAHWRDRMNRENLPGRWHWGVGEASRPLSTGGYYLHKAYCVLFENQYVERFYEMRLDTLGRKPSRHVLELARCEADESEVRRTEYIVTRSVTPTDPHREASQRWAEKTIHEKALELMEEYNNEQ